MTNWKVKLYEALPPGSVPAARAIDTFGVQTETSTHDAAKEAVKKWLRDRSYIVRTVNFVAGGNEMVAYVMPKGTNR